MTTADTAFQNAWALHQAGDLRRAEEAYRTLLRTTARPGKVWFVLGNLCAAQGRLVEAAACIRQALETEPREVMGHVHLGNVLLQQEKYAEAEAVYRRALQLQAGQLEALVNLGFVLGEQDRLDEAQACYEQARALAPDVPEVHHNLGNVFREKHQLDEAIACYDTALRLRPDYAKAFINKGVALVARAAVDDALVCLKRGVELQPDFAEAHNSLGTALSAHGDVDGALAEYEQAIRLKPDYPDAHWNRALVRLLRGDYERGWPDYEWRWRCKRAFPLPQVRQPRWDGSPLDGRTILLYAEQGLGDTLQFIRYAAGVKACGGRVVMQCQGALMPLLARLTAIDELAAWGAPPPACDVWAPLMSLPALLQTTLATVPADVPYLVADAGLVEHWRPRIAALPGFTVGIAWQGSPRHAWDRHRSVPLALFAPLAALPNVRLVSLQKNLGAEQLTQAGAALPVTSFGEALDRGGAFTDTAAILQHLDLVITIDTAIAHLAGALGVPTWVAVHHTPDWRWLLGPADNPWYPTVRLFRQDRAGDWSPVFGRIAAALAPLAAAGGRPRPLHVEVSAGELVDKLTILRIKGERITDAARRANVQAEMDTLAAARAALGSGAACVELERQLHATNERLWEIEDAIRACEQRQDFGADFIALARAVYQTNDRRAALKRAVNELLHSRLVEEKSYAGEPIREK